MKKIFNNMVITEELILGVLNSVNESTNHKPSYSSLAKEHGKEVVNSVIFHLKRSECIEYVDKECDLPVADVSNFAYIGDEQQCIGFKITDKGLQYFNRLTEYVNQ